MKLNICELESARPTVRKNVKLTPAEYRAYSMGWLEALNSALAVAELAVEQFEIRERYARRARKLAKGA